MVFLSELVRSPFAPLVQSFWQEVIIEEREERASSVTLSQLVASGMFLD